MEFIGVKGVLYRLIVNDGLNSDATRSGAAMVYA
jgi:hypothetical protein